MVATGEGGFRQVAALASERNPPCPSGQPGKSLILIHNAEAICGGGFQVASPVKKPRASEMPRCAPPYTFGAGEEPCRGGTASLPAHFLHVCGFYSLLSPISCAD
jgi:hypothetical protein